MLCYSHCIYFITLSYIILYHIAHVYNVILYYITYVILYYNTIYHITFNTFYCIMLCYVILSYHTHSYSVDLLT